MRSVESEGNTIDEAIENALRLLRLDRDAVEIEILENATKGVFGFGTKKARVRARERATLDAVLTASGAETQAPVASARAPIVSTSQPAAPVSSDVPRETPRSTAAAPSRQPATAGTSREPTTTLGLRDTLVELLGRMDVDCTVEVRSDPAGEAVVLRVSGRDGGIVIGRRGQTLDAIEHLMNRIALRESLSNPTRVRIDVEGYRERRQESLEQLARRLADKAKATGRVVTLNPMSPRDRRVIHITLQSDEDVTTWSQGEGHFRRLLIGPRDERRQGRQRSER
jgi:spoIIIJ-associated protein